MTESHLVEGRQDIGNGREGQSVTDACKGRKPDIASKIGHGPLFCGRKWLLFS